MTCEVSQADTAAQNFERSIYPEPELHSSLPAPLSVTAPNSDSALRLSGRDVWLVRPNHAITDTKIFG